MRKIVLSILAVLLLGFTLNAQNVRVSGVVTDPGGEPMVGVTVSVQGTQVGTVTGVDGRYSISVPSGGVIEFAHLGMVTQIIPVSGRTNINVQLSQDTETIDDVIVVAYGTASKSSYVGSASVVSGETIGQLQTSNVTKALEGAAAGVQVMSSTGRPGSSASIRIRGIGSYSAQTTPLYVVDGIPFEGEISSINPSDIESMTVLKDAAANSLYGSRASNGVILITTKKGKLGQPRVTLEARVGVNQRAIPNYDVMTDPGEYYEMMWEAVRNRQYYNVGNTWMQAGNYASNSLVGLLGGYNNYNVPDNQLIDPNTGFLNPSAKLRYQEVWEDEMFRNGMRQEYNASISGADKLTSYYFSVGYLTDEGYIINSKFDRFSSRLRLDRQVKDWLKVGMNMSYVNQKRDFTSENNSEGVNMFFIAQSMAPIYPVYLYDKTSGNVVKDDDGNRVYDFGDDAGYARPVSSMANPVASQRLDMEHYDDNIFNGKMFADITFLKDFKFTVNYSMDVTNTSLQTYANGIYGQFKGKGGIAGRYAVRDVSQSSNQLLTWARSFGRHDFNVMVGHESFREQYNYLYASKEKFLDPDQRELAGAINNPNATSYQNNYALESYLSRIEYGFDEKYYLTASLRTDGSSKFHVDNRWGTFWSAGVSWRMKREDFLANVKWIDDLKFKASYGTQGNDKLFTGTRGYYPWQDHYQITNVNNTIGLVFLYQGNKNITWEKSGTFNTGFDYTLLDRRITGSLEWFYKKTTDMLFDRPQPASSGITSYPDNIGDMVNHGIEFEITGFIIDQKDLKWSVNLNATHFKNKITKLPPESVANGIVDGRFILKEGYSRYEYYMPEYAGVSDNGEAQWYMDVTDTNGKVTKERTTDYSKADKYFLGSAIPKLYGGIGTSFYFKGIDLSLQTSYQIGGKGYDHTYAYTMGGNEYGQNMHKDLRNRWTPDNTNTDVPRLEVGNSSTSSNRMSSRWFVSSNYFNIRNITLGYTLPQRWLDSIGIESLRIYAVMDNVALFSKRKGYDPRTSWAGVSSFGQYAPIRTTSIGLSLAF